MELYFKTIFVFIHFLLAAYCLVSVGSMDWKILTAYGKPLTNELYSDIGGVKTSITLALAGLWFTGAVIVAYGAYTVPEYLANQKLWFKFFVVVALTFNGIYLHKLSGIVKPGLVFAGLNDRAAIRLNLAGAVSSVSWVWACFIGTARAWNGKLSFSTLMGFYLASLAAAMLAALFLHSHWKKKTAQVAA